MTIEECIEDPSWKLYDQNDRIFFAKRLRCGHYSTFNPEYGILTKHIPIIIPRQGFIKDLNKKDYFMIPTKENLIKTYKTIPLMRHFLTSLYGEFMSEADLLTLKQEEKIKELESKLENCIGRTGALKPTDE